MPDLADVSCKLARPAAATFVAMPCTTKHQLHCKLITKGAACHVHCSMLAAAHFKVLVLYHADTIAVSARYNKPNSYSAIGLLNLTKG